MERRNMRNEQETEAGKKDSIGRRVTATGRKREKERESKKERNEKVWKRRHRGEKEGKREVRRGWRG